jgi:hypothetical protein
MWDDPREIEELFGEVNALRRRLEEAPASQVGELAALVAWRQDMTDLLREGEALFKALGAMRGLNIAAPGTKPGPRD